MIAIMPVESNRVCTFKQYAPAWRLGTGVRLALEPGVYQVTGEDRVDGVLYLRLANAYRIDSRVAMEFAI